MGNHNQRLTRGRSQERKDKMLPILLTSATILSLAVGAPQYGGVQPASPVKTAPLTGSVQCRTEYATLWDTEYKETETQVCTTEYEKVCRSETQRLCQPTTRQVCSTVYENQCQTVFKSVCVEQYKTEYEPYTETECSTQYKDDCEYQWEGYGNDKVWAPIAGTCKKNPYETCKDVSKTKERQVAYPVCNDVPEKKCVDVPRQQCVSVPDQICTNQPLQKCQDVPRQNCQAVHKKVPVRVSRKVPKKVCQDGYQGVGSAGIPENFVPLFTGSGPEIIDARQKSENNSKNVLFERSQVVDEESDNAIVFGD